MTATLTRIVNHVTQYRLQRLRPAKFRQILPIDRTVPPLALTVEHGLITVHGETPVKLSPTQLSKHLPMPDYDISKDTIAVHNFGLAWGVTNDEVARAEQTGQNPTSIKALANQNIVEAYLDAAAAGALYSTLGIRGLYNNDSVTIDTACTKTAGGTTWPVATYAEIARDVSELIDAVDSATYQLYQSALVIIPQVRMKYLTQTRHPVTDRSILSRLQEDFPGVRFESWYRGDTADAAGTGPRAIAMAAGDEVARMIITRELEDGTPIQMPWAYQIPQRFGFAGCLIEAPTAIRYLDGI